ncbi:PREDICTED: poly(U)-specific endoribonuclease-B-like [Branchiostoma belcheri]|uniref:Uridylate-specific endoribonuclease n=1 Tax=Branchiostoma belcheri TaxID=7741 RepID=A0A6P5AQ25_BRABE|nr:PREDICTED: poly(U)-specific endoribonuclease-B-like [Branchiostoma belcheri]
MANVVAALCQACFGANEEDQPPGNKYVVDPTPEDNRIQRDQPEEPRDDRESEDQGQEREGDSMPIEDPDPVQDVVVDPAISYDDSLSGICTRLWELDTNRLQPGRDYEIDTQGRARYVEKGGTPKDMARDPLFAWVDEDKLHSIPTFKAFISLLDNYSHKVGESEEVTAEEEEENWTFLNACLETDVFQEAHKYLAGKDLVPEDEEGFKQRLYDLWFKLYSRTRGRMDSSGFEHVFVGETRGRNKEVTGLHNWVQFYLQEKKGSIDYTGFKSRGTDNYDQLITIQFTWNGNVKPVGSSFIGTSPEFELALYTVCFLVGDGKDRLSLADYDVDVVTHRFGRYIGTSYPMAK